jgi:hypothetical protein
VFAAAFGLEQRVPALEEREDLEYVKPVVEALCAGNPELFVCERRLPVQEVGLGLVQHYLLEGDECACDEESRMHIHIHGCALHISL